MSIVSFSFFVFLGATALLYYLCPRRFRWGVLLGASGVFCILGASWQLYLLFLGQTLLAWWGGVLLGQMAPGKVRSRVCALFILAQLAVLFVLKDSSFFTNNANALLGLTGSTFRFPALELAAPLGVSYYTLMLVSYLCDIQWEKTEPQRNPLKLILFAGFFPQMVSGPFTRYGEIGGTLYEGHRFSYEEVTFGLQRLVWGLFKKLVLSARLGAVVDTVYGGQTVPQTGVYVLIGAFGYVLQLYTDFSGCMDIVLGAGQLFGIHLPENFRTPFYSVSLSEFWRRWHITLGAWLKDYVMYPLQRALTTRFGKAAREKLGKQRGKDLLLYAAMLVTWFSIGLWHGGSWKYIFSSGLFFFLMIVGGMLLQPIFDRLKALLRINPQAKAWIWFSRVRTTVLFTLSVSIGRSPSLRAGVGMWLRLFDLSGGLPSPTTLGLDRWDLLVTAGGLVLLVIVGMLQQRGDLREAIARRPLPLRWALWVLLVLGVLVLGWYGPGYDAQAFIYQKF